MRVGHSGWGGCGAVRANRPDLVTASFGYFDQRTSWKAYLHHCVASSAEGAETCLPYLVASSPRTSLFWQVAKGEFHVVRSHYPIQSSNPRRTKPHSVAYPGQSGLPHPCLRRPSAGLDTNWSSRSRAREGARAGAVADESRFACACWVSNAGFEFVFPWLR